MKIERICENCVFFKKDEYTQIGECESHLKEEPQCKFMVYAKDSAQFCKDYQNKGENNG